MCIVYNDKCIEYFFSVFNWLSRLSILMGKGILNCGILVFSVEVLVW